MLKGFNNLYIIILASYIFALSAQAAVDSCANEPCLQIRPRVPSVMLPLKAGKLSGFIDKMLESIGQEEVLKDDIAIPFNISTIKAIANTLKAMQKLNERNITYKFNSMKWLINNSYLPAKLTSDEIINFFKAADYLDIQDLLRPAASLYINLMLEDKRLKGKDKFARLMRTIKRDMKITKEQFFYFDDYIKWQQDPLVFIKGPFSSKTEVTPEKAFQTINNKTYAIAADRENITVTDDNNPDAFTNIRLGKQLSDLVIIGQKLYVADFDGGVVYIIDTKTDQGIGEIKASDGPVSLAARDSILFIATKWANEIIIINTITNQPIGEALRVAGQPTSLTMSGNKLYVSIQQPNNSQNNIIFFEFKPQFLYYSNN